MIKRNITYVKRCLHPKCTHREKCEHGQTQMRFLQLFPKGLDEVPYNMLWQIQTIYPVAYGCPRWKLTRNQCIELQNKQQEKV